MTLLDYLDGIARRRQRRWELRQLARAQRVAAGMGRGWPDARGWIGIGSYALVVLIVMLIWLDRTLLNNDFFKVIATAIILTGWNGGPLSWAYAATKTGGELADRNAAQVQAAADRSVNPQPVTVVNPASDPVPVEPAKGGGEGTRSNG